MQVLIFPSHAGNVDKLHPEGAIFASAGGFPDVRVR
jgi:hypothetical protein